MSSLVVSNRGAGGKTFEFTDSPLPRDEREVKSPETNSRTVDAIIGELSAPRNGEFMMGR